MGSTWRGWGDLRAEADEGDLVVEAAFKEGDVESKVERELMAGDRRAELLVVANQQHLKPHGKR